MIKDLFYTWQTGRIRRWHNQVNLSHTNDFLDGHYGRVARMMIMLKPDVSAEALRYALIHDDGERMSGDTPYPAKRKYPELALVSRDVENQERCRVWGPDPQLTEDELDLIEICDRLDSWLWALAHGSGRSKPWQDMLRKIRMKAALIDVLDEVKELINVVKGH
ncbi:MAG: hypothetical protein AAGF53_02395 [Pseudomonadota bacterium]